MTKRASKSRIKTSESVVDAMVRLATDIGVSPAMLGEMSLVEYRTARAAKHQKR